MPGVAPPPGRPPGPGYPKGDHGMGMWVGRGRKARAAYGFDDIALVPGAVTINPNEVDISWDLCGRRFQIPIIAAAMDGVVSPALAMEMGRLGGLAVLNLEGIFSRYENPEGVLDRITPPSREEATKIIQGIYGEPIKEDLIHKRITEIKKGGGPVVVSSIPQRAERFAKIAEGAGPGGAAGDRDRGLGRGARFLLQADRAVRANHHGRRHDHRRGHLQGAGLGRGCGDDRLRLRPRP